MAPCGVGAATFLPLGEGAGLAKPFSMAAAFLRRGSSREASSSTAIANLRSRMEINEHKGNHNERKEEQLPLISINLCVAKKNYGYFVGSAIPAHLPVFCAARLSSLLLQQRSSTQSPPSDSVCTTAFSRSSTDSALRQVVEPERTMRSGRLLPTTWIQSRKNGNK